MFRENFSLLISLRYEPQNRKRTIVVDIQQSFIYVWVCDNMQIINRIVERDNLEEFFVFTFLFLDFLFVLHFHFFCFDCVHRRRHPKKTLCQRANEHRHDTEFKWHFEIFLRIVKHRIEPNLFRLTRTQHHNSFRSSQLPQSHNSLFCEMAKWTSKMSWILLRLQWLFMFAIWWLYTKNLVASSSSPSSSLTSSPMKERDLSSDQIATTCWSTSYALYLR